MSPMRLLLLSLLLLAPAGAHSEAEPVRVFIFAGQSNMVGADSKVADVDRYAPFVGWAEAQEDVRFSYALGRETKKRSDGWVDLAPIDGMVGPELSFARAVKERTGAPVAIIKVAAGGTHLGGDWNPDEPQGFELYPLLVRTVRESLALLDEKRVGYRLEALVWHQGENDMFEDAYRDVYGANLENFLARLRADLGAPELPAFVGELCTKTIWGMDNRGRMEAIARGQRSAAAADPRTTYVRTNHIAVEIGGDDGLHYHYGTLGQLEHGLEHASAYLSSVGLGPEVRPALERWPLRKGKPVRLYVLAGHRNMEGERAFAADLAGLKGGKRLARDRKDVPFRYSTGGGVHVSQGWEALGPAGRHGTFGPELSFASTLSRRTRDQIAVAKFTHSGSQILDWTPEGSDADARDLYPAFLAFVRDSVASLEARGHDVEIAGIVYHLGENDMSFHPYRRMAAERVAELVRASRRDLERPALPWYLSQQAPTKLERLKELDPVKDIARFAESDEHTVHLPLEGSPQERERLVMEAAGVVWLGEWLAERVAEREAAR